MNNLLGVSGQRSGGVTTYDTRDVNSGLLDQRAPGGSSTYLQDGLGSIVGVISPAGTILNTTTYDPYGQTIVATGTAPSPFGYASGLQAPGGLVKYGQRYYDPTSGRWAVEPIDRFIP